MRIRDEEWMLLAAGELNGFRWVVATVTLLFSEKARTRYAHWQSTHQTLAEAFGQKTPTTAWQPRGSVSVLAGALLFVLVTLAAAAQVVQALRPPVPSYRTADYESRPPVSRPLE